VALLGIYHTVRATGHYVRVALICEPVELTASALDPDIVQASWLTPSEIAQHRCRPRSELTLRCIDDYLAGQRYTLDCLR
jgi:hypothetical protein